MKKYVPILQWLPNYRRADLKGDIYAGITVGIMLVPQGMAYAMIAGMPPIYGLYAAFIPQVIYALFGSSRQLSVAPSAMVSLLIYAGISSMATPGSEHFVSLAIVLALMVGVLQLLFGLARLGFLVNFLPGPVITGYTAAAAIIIALSQLRHLLGVDMPSSNLLHVIIKNTLAHLGEIQWFTVLLGVSAIVLMTGIKRINKSLPGPIIIVVLGILAVYLFRLNDHGIQILGGIPQGIPMPALPTVTISLVRQLLPLALIISLVGFMESISVAKAIQAKRRNYAIVANNELTALGFANIVGSFFQAFPVSGGLGRSAVNEQAGANTNLSSVFSAILMGITLAFLTPLFYFLPKVVLAAIIIVAVASLINIREAGFYGRLVKRISSWGWSRLFALWFLEFRSALPLAWYCRWHLFCTAALIRIPRGWANFPIRIITGTSIDFQRPLNARMPWFSGSMRSFILPISTFSNHSSINFWR